MPGSMALMPSSTNFAARSEIVRSAPVRCSSVRKRPALVRELAPPLGRTFRDCLPCPCDVAGRPILMPGKIEHDEVVNPEMRATETLTRQRFESIWTGQLLEMARPAARVPLSTRAGAPSTYWPWAPDRLVFRGDCRFSTHIPVCPRDEPHRR
jgi:hypothetical protein